MQSGRNWNERSGTGRGNPYPPLDSLSITEDLEPRPDYNYESAGVNYKPLVALNLDIGEAVPVKIYVYDFTDPWKRAYEFLKAYDLPEEMHEDIAVLIGNAKEAKEKEMRLLRLAQEKKMAMLGAKSKKLDFKGESSKRRTSCDVKFSNSASKNFSNDPTEPINQRGRDAYKEQRESANRSLLARNKSIEHYHQPRQMTSASKAQFGKLVELEFKKDGTEKSNFLDSTTLMSSISDKTKTVAQASPFESNLGEETELEYSAMRTTNSPVKRLTIDTLTPSRPTQDETPSDTMTPKGSLTFKQSYENREKDALIRQIFERLDYEGSGFVRSYDVYLSDLPSDTKNILQAILSDQDDKDGFKAFDLAEFSRALVSSHDFVSLRIHN